jgi:Fe-S oxidoreductase
MLYFRGCIAREKLNSVSIAVEKLLKEADVDFEINSDEECCGSVLLRTGFREDAEVQMEKNMDYLKGQTILVSCAGCYKTLKKDYKDIMGFELNVIHTSELFMDLIRENKLKIEKSHLKVTYHDPCHLGRHMGEYESPREVINALASLVEMANIKEKSRCCGSGGGVKSAFPELADSISDERIKEAKNTGASILTTSCPFCSLNLNKSGVLEDMDLKVMDISELLLDYLLFHSEG